MLRSPRRTRGLTIGLLTFLSVIAVQSQAPLDIMPADPVILVGSGPGSAHVKVFRGMEDTPLLDVTPYGGGFTGGVRVAAGDINGDGVTDVVTGMASNGGQVRGFSGTDGSSLGVMTPFGPAFTGGVFVAVGDVNADGHDDILLGAGTGGLARLMDGASQTELGFGRPFPAAYTGGVTVAMGDVNGDGRADLLFGTTLGGLVRIFDGATLTEIASGFPYGPLFLGGVNVAAGDVNGDGIDEVAFAPRNSGGPVRVYTMQGDLVIEGQPFSGVQGVSLALADLNGDGRDDLVMGAGAGGAPRVRAFSVLDRTPLRDTLAFDPTFTGGVFVATPSGARTRFTSGNTVTFTAGTPGSFTVTTANGSDVTLSAGGTLPAGVTFTDNGNGTGTLAGTAALGSGGQYVLTMVAHRGANQVASQAFTLNVQEPANISSVNATTFAIGGPNTFMVTTTGHPAATTLSVTGLLPAGVTFTNNSNGTGALAGSPSAGSEGTYPLTISASNGIGSPAVQMFTLTVAASSTPLFTTADEATLTVGSLGSFSIETSAIPVVGTITVTGMLPAGVTFTDHGNGTATLTGVPDSGTVGIYPLVFTADNGMATTPQIFTLSVDPLAGGAPAFTSDNTATFAADALGGFAVTTTGFPVATLTLTGALPSGVTFVDNADGTASFTGTPTAGAAGSYPLQLTATNGAGSITQLFTLTIANVTSAPVFTSGATTAFVIGTNGTFAITTAANPQVTSITLTGALPAFLSFVDNGDGTATLSGTPDTGTSGPYALTFTATNGMGAPVTQAFTLSVQQAPLFLSPNARAFTVGIADSFIVQTASLPVSTVVLTGTLPNGLAYVDNGNGSGTISGAADAGTVGSYPLTFTATNGVGAPVAQTFTLSVTQNTVPTLDAIPDPAAILEDAGQQTINLTGISAGVGDTQPLAVTATSSDPTIVPNPTVTYTTPNATGTLQYTPVPNASGSVIITATVTDGGLDNDLGTVGDNGVFSQTFTVTVTAVNDTPTLDAISDPAAIDEDAPQQTVNLTGIGAGGGETQQLQVIATSDNFCLIADPTVTYTSPGATGSLTYEPIAGLSGSAIITVTVTDGGLDNNLGTPGDNLTTTRTFTVVVNDVDDAPTIDAIADPAAINEDAGLQTVNLAGISAGIGESATLIVTALSNNTTLIPNPSVTYASPNATGSLSYTPVANQSGSAVVTVTVSDGGATPTQRTFTVNVNAVNDAPTFTPGGNQSVNEDATAQTVNSFLGTVSAGPNEGSQVVTVNITNVTNPSLFSAGPAISSAGVLTYTPAAELFGTSMVTYTVSDNGGTANGGVDSVGPFTFSITINPVNDPPTLGPIASPVTILEDAGQQTVNLTGITSGPTAENAQPLQVTSSSLDPTLIPNPTVTYASPDSTGSISYTPVANASGSTTLFVTVTDGGLDNDLATTGDNQQVTRAFVVNVTAVNDAPSFTKGGDQTVNEDAGAQTVNPWATAVSAGPGEGAQTVQFEITNNSNPSLFSALSVSTTGVLSYTPAAQQNGVATITLRITDDGGTANGGINASATQTFTITVNPVNDAPVAQAKSYNAQANIAITGLSGLLTGVTDADSGVNGCTPTFSVASVSATTPAGGNITNLDVNAGTFDFNPPPGVTGNVTFTYTVQDTGCPGTATSAPATATVNVAGPAIWFVDDSAAGGGDGRLTSPFNTLAAAAAVDAAGHVIFLYSGTYTSAITLNATESLMGQGAIAASFDVLMGINPPAGTVARPSIGGTRPSISVTSGTAVTLASGNVVHGLNVSNTNGAGITGAAVGTLALANFDVTVTGGSALSLTASGTVTATGTDNDLSSTNGSALNVSGVNIGAAGLNIKSINSTAASASPGIILSNTGGAGGLSVSGTGTTAGSGGTISNKTGDGISLSNTSHVSFRNMIVSNNQGSGNPTPDPDVMGGGIAGTNVTNFELIGSTVSNNGNQPDGTEAGVRITNLWGTAAITNSTFSGQVEDHVRITNTSGTLTNLTVSGTTFNANSAATGGHALSLIGSLTANMTLTVSSSIFDDIRASGVLFHVQDDETGNVSVTGSTFTDVGHAVTLQSSENADLTFDISTNTVLRALSNAIEYIAGTTSTTSSNIVGRVSGNQIGNDTMDSGVIGGTAVAYGIPFDLRGDQNAIVAIENNIIKHTDWEGIWISSADFGTVEGNDLGDLQLTVTGNNVGTPDDNGNPFDAEADFPLGVVPTTRFEARHDTVLRVNIDGNTFATGVAASGMLLRQRNTAAFGIQGYGGAASDAPAVANFLDSPKNTSTVTVQTDGTNTIVNYTNAGTIQTPP